MDTILWVCHQNIKNIPIVKLMKRAQYRHLILEHLPGYLLINFFPQSVFEPLRLFFYFLQNTIVHLAIQFWVFEERRTEERNNNARSFNRAIRITIEIICISCTFPSKICTICSLCVSGLLCVIRDELFPHFASILQTNLTTFFSLFVKWFGISKHTNRHKSWHLGSIAWKWSISAHELTKVTKVFWKSVQISRREFENIGFTPK